MIEFFIGLIIAGLLLATFFILGLQRESFCTTEKCRIDQDMIRHLKSTLNVIAPDSPYYEINPGSESVTVNKEQIYICLRNPDKNTVYPFDILLYVAIHELAHVFSKTYSTKSHNDEFKSNFEKLLKRAYDKNLLSQTVVVPEDYCKKGKGNMLDFFSPRIF